MDTVTELSKDLEEYLKSYCGITNEEVLKNTPKRFLAFLADYSSGNKEYNDFKTFPETCNNMVTVEVPFYSLCEHHLLPYFGTAFVGYLPKDEVLGLSKIVKFVQHSFRKPSKQESVTMLIADTLNQKVNTSGVAVVTRAFHCCYAMRYSNGWTTSATMVGKFDHRNKGYNPHAKEEFLTYIQPRLNELRL
jgi:GTP cyclohydrolase I